MKQVIVVRHGDAPGIHLSELGRVQALELADRIRQISGDTGVAIASSPKERAMETGFVLSQRLPAAAPTATYLLAIDGSNPFEIERLTIQLSKIADIVVLVTHQEEIQRIIRGYARKNNLPGPQLPKEVRNCQGFLIDIEAKAIASFPA